MDNSYSALLLVDLQNDFCMGGSLAIEKADEVIAVANHFMPFFKHIIATQDWHPKNHASFISTWPMHCVQHSKGAAFHPDLHIQHITKIIQKGTEQHIDSYSAFYDNQHLKSTGLTDYLRAQRITDLYIMGLATEYCVKFSCLDAIADGFTVYLILKGCRGINKCDIKNAMTEMQNNNVQFISSLTLGL